MIAFYVSSFINDGNKNDNKKILHDIKRTTQAFFTNQIKHPI